MSRISERYRRCPGSRSAHWTETNSAYRGQCNYCGRYYQLFDRRLPTHGHTVPAPAAECAGQLELG